MKWICENVFLQSDHFSCLEAFYIDSSAAKQWPSAGTVEFFQGSGSTEYANNQSLYHMP